VQQQVILHQEYVVVETLVIVNSLVRVRREKEQTLKRDRVQLETDFRVKIGLHVLTKEREIGHPLKFIIPESFCNRVEESNKISRRSLKLVH
jgi:hypothetical protein